MEKENVIKSAQGKTLPLKPSLKCAQLYLNQPGRQHISPWPCHLLQLLIMAALWSVPRCKDIFAPPQWWLYICPNSARTRVGRQENPPSKTIYCDRQLEIQRWLTWLFFVSSASVVLSAIIFCSLSQSAITEARMCVVWAPSLNHDVKAPNPQVRWRWKWRLCIIPSGPYDLLFTSQVWFLTVKMKWSVFPLPAKIK